MRPQQVRWFKTNRSMRNMGNMRNMRNTSGGEEDDEDVKVNVNIWAWLMPSGRIYRVMTSPEEGTIRVYNHRGELIKKADNLSAEAVRLVERNFLQVVATMVKGSGSTVGAEGEGDEEEDESLFFYIR